MSPSQTMKKGDLHHEDHNKVDKMMHPFFISDSKTPFLQSPNTNKKEINYSASGAKIYKDDVNVSDLQNNLFSQDLADEENKNNLFSFLGKSNSQPQLANGENRNREAFNNITNTLNKSPSFYQRDSSNNLTENLTPKVLSFDAKK
jgi:hypothetical protein